MYGLTLLILYPMQGCHLYLQICMLFLSLLQFGLQIMKSLKTRSDQVWVVVSLLGFVDLGTVGFYLKV